MSFEERGRVQDLGDARLREKGRTGAREGVGRSQAMWSAVTGLAIVVILFAVFYGIYEHENANPPAVTASPAPAAGVPAPAPQTTTGQGASRPESAPAGNAPQ